MLFLWFYHACRRGSPRFMMVSDHINYLTFEDPGAVHTVRRALKLAEAGDLYGAAETAGVDVTHAAVVSQGLRRGMRFAIGAELDNDPRARPDAQNIVDAMRPDGMIRSVHFLTIDHPEKGADYQWAFDNPEFKDLHDVVGTDRVWELYMAKLIDDIEKLPGQIVAHFYVPATFGHWPEQTKLERHEDRLLEACAARGMAIEINTRFLYRDHPPEDKEHYRAAILRLMKKAKAKDVGIAIASDAHSPKDQGAGFAEILRMLDEAKINEIVFPVAGRLARVALRATKEHLQKVKSQEPQPQPGSSISGFSRAELGLPERDEAQEREVASSAKAARDATRRRAASAARVVKPKPVKVPRVPKPKAEPKSKPEPKVKVKADAKVKAEAKVKVPLKAKAAPKSLAVKAKPVPKPAAKPAAKSVAKPAPKTNCQKRAEGCGQSRETRREAGAQSGCKTRPQAGAQKSRTREESGPAGEKSGAHKENRAGEKIGARFQKSTRKKSARKTDGNEENYFKTPVRSLWYGA